jgi:GxxExxY protein
MTIRKIDSRGDAENTAAMRENAIGTQVLEAAINVHRELGPGLFETVYEVILARELSDVGLKLDRQVPVPIIYKGIRFDEGFRADIIVEGMVLLELKSVERVLPAHKKQVQTYLRLTGLKLGYLLNFGEAVLKSGITRCVNGLPEYPPMGHSDDEGL